MLSLTRYVLVCTVLAWLAGCSKEKLSELVDQAKEQVSENVDKASQALQQKAKTASDTAQQQLGLAGSIAFELDVPVKTKGCYVAFVAAQGGRPAVLQLRSYPTAEQEAFPAAFIQAPTNAAAFADLVGQTLSAQAFVQVEPSGAVWHTVGGEPVQLRVTAIADRRLTAELRGSAINTSTGQTAPLAGVVDGYLE